MKALGDRVKKQGCYSCGKDTLSNNEIGLIRKLLDNNAKRFYCIDCLALYLEVDTEFLQAKVQEFKEQGCSLF